MDRLEDENVQKQVEYLLSEGDIKVRYDHNGEMFLKLVMPEVETDYRKLEHETVH